MKLKQLPLIVCSSIIFVVELIFYNKKINQAYKDVQSRGQDAYKEVTKSFIRWSAALSFCTTRKMRLSKTIQSSMDFTISHMQIIKPTKIHRNDPCPCGSGKKKKQCCNK